MGATKVVAAVEGVTTWVGACRARLFCVRNSNAVRGCWSWREEAVTPERLLDDEKHVVGPAVQGSDHLALFDPAQRGCHGSPAVRSAASLLYCSSTRLVTAHAPPFPLPFHLLSPWTKHIEGTAH